MADKTDWEWSKILDSIPDFISVHDVNYRLVKVNKPMANFLGGTPEEFAGRLCYEVLHCSDDPWSTCPHRKMLETKNVVTSYVDDPHIGTPLLVTASPIFNDKGELIGSVHVAKDISNRSYAVGCGKQQNGLFK